MKTFKKICFALIAVVVLSFTACAHFDELNEDPNSSGNMNPNLMIPTVQFLTQHYWQAQHRIFAYPGGFMNQWTGDWAVLQGAWGARDLGYMEYLWSTAYSNHGLVRNVVDIVERTRGDAEMVNTHAMARIMRVQTFMQLTDYYGDIPYFDAGMGFFNGVLMPRYDTQEEIYRDFLKELREAAAMFDSSRPVPPVDFFYNGNIERWRRFANSLRLRAAMRLVNVEYDLARAETLDAVASGVFQSNDDILFLAFEDVRNPGGEPGPGNPISVLLRNIANVDGSTFFFTRCLIQRMEEINDPRIRFYAAVLLNNPQRTDITDQVFAQRGSYAAMAVPTQMPAWETEVDNPFPGSETSLNVVVSGETVTVDMAFTRLRPSHYIMAFDAPRIIISYAEVEFLQAEMAVRGWITGADEHFRRGMEAAVMQWTLFGANVDPAVAADFANSNPLVAGEEMNQINTQLWILHFIDPIEAWSNWRRVGYPEIVFYNRNPAVNMTGGQTPRRMEYPLEEQMRNPSNWREAVNRMGGTDSWMNRVWWDVN